MKTHGENMGEQNELDDDVVVIEQRDKKTLIYIAIAAVIGIALGGLIGGYWSSSHWKAEYQQLSASLTTLKGKNQQQARSDQAKTQQELATLKSGYEEKLATEKAYYQTEIGKLQDQLTALKKTNEQLSSKVNRQQSQLATTERKNSKLSHQNSLQASVFERSRELFQKELKVKQELEALIKEKQTLTRKLVDLKKECDLYLQGTSWDARSNSCDLQDSSNARLSQVNQLIHVRQMDLNEIHALSKEIGLDK